MQGVNWEAKKGPEHAKSKGDRMEDRSYVRITVTNLGERHCIYTLRRGFCSVNP